MTKVGEGDGIGRVPTAADYHKTVDQCSMKFLNALEMYKTDGSDREQLKALMDQQLSLIRSAVSEIKRAGIYKQEVKVENDYKAFMSDSSDTNFAALEHDLMTLREYNQLDKK